MDRLAIVVLGNRNSGKSTTWNRLFNATVRTGKYQRSLYLNGAQSTEVFVVSGSPEERGEDVGAMLPEPLPQIVLCSAQYREDVARTFDYFVREGYEVLVQWLNPGYSDGQPYADHLGLFDHLVSSGVTIQRRDGTVDPSRRVKEIRQFILGWTSYRDLLKTEFPA